MTPVMYLDSVGTSPQWWNPFSWSNETKIIAAVVLIASLTISTVATGGAAGAVDGMTLAGGVAGYLMGGLSSIGNKLISDVTSSFYGTNNFGS